MAAPTVEQALHLAIAHHQAGRLADAEALYRQILAVDSRHVDALHLLGVIAHHVGRLDVAADLITKAIAIRPDYAAAHSNLGNVLQDQDKLDDAIAAYRRAIACRPDFADAQSNLGNALKHKGQMKEAMDAYRQAIALNPNYPEAHHNLSGALIDLGRLEDAIAVCHQALALRPNYAEAFNNLGIALKDRGQFDAAVIAYGQAIANKPDYAEAYNNLGSALRGRGQLDEAVAACRHAIALKPGMAEAYGNLGNILIQKGEMVEAIAACRQAVALRPNYAEALSNLGIALNETGEFDAAIPAGQKAVVLKPNLAEAHYNLAFALLVHGDFAQGWEEYEWRWKSKDAAYIRRNFSEPRWDGGNLEGRTLLLHAEQGYGDTIHFVRYLPMVQERGGKVVIECQRELQRLLQANLPGLTVVARGETLPFFDVHFPLLSLPYIFATDLTNIPRNIPYLDAAATDIGVWCGRLAQPASSLNVGIAWAGDPSHRNDRNRSIKPGSLAPLAEVRGVRFFSLQKGAAAAQADLLPPGMKTVCLGDELKDFADTAALIANLDLIIAVDTAVVHLAGAMGKPVWTLVPFAPDWRWLLDREDSPWYPTMRLFRQPAIGDWDSVIRRVAQELAAVKK